MQFFQSMFRHSRFIGMITHKPNMQQVCADDEVVPLDTMAPGLKRQQMSAQHCSRGVVNADKGGS